MSKVIVDVGNDDIAETVIRLVRRRLPRTVIVVRGTTPGALARLLANGATEAFCDASIAGKLLAATAVTAPHPPGRRLD